MKTKLRFICFLLIVMVNISTSQTKKSDLNVLIKDVKANLEFLSSDELEGREAGTQAEKTTTLYIASELKKYGIKPFGDNGTYFQNFKYPAYQLDPKSTISILDANSKELSCLKLKEDFLTSSFRQTKIDIPDSPLEIIFVKYGISAKEFKYDDYADIDVKDKIVVVLDGEPNSTDGNYFNGAKPSRYANPFSKLMTAEKNGAAGFILIADKQTQDRWWKSLESMVDKKNVSLPIRESGPDSKLEKRRMPIFLLLAPEKMKSLLENEDYNLDKIESLLKEDKVPEIFKLKKKIKPNISLIESEKTFRNVLGVIEGTNPRLSNEYVTIGAHLDHVGTNDHGVYNGADDNASGTVAIIETARLLNSMKKNQRPIEICLWTGEELGLVGSNYFVENLPKDCNIVVNINLDMIGREYRDSIFVIGAKMSSKELAEIIDKVNKSTVKMTLDYSMDKPGGMTYGDSDHSSFMRKGIPAVFFWDKMLSDLHQPSDDIEKINFEKMEKMVKLVTNIALKISNLDHKLKPEKSLTPDK
jgi:hypothetical protein